MRRPLALPLALALALGCARKAPDEFVQTPPPDPKASARSAEAPGPAAPDPPAARPREVCLALDSAGQVRHFPGGEAEMRVPGQGDAVEWVRIPALLAAALEGAPPEPPREGAAFPADPVGTAPVLLLRRTPDSPASRIYFENVFCGNDQEGLDRAREKIAARKPGKALDIDAGAELPAGTFVSALRMARETGAGEVGFRAPPAETLETFGDAPGPPAKVAGAPAEPDVSLRVQAAPETAFSRLASLMMLCARMRVRKVFFREPGGEWVDASLAVETGLRPAQGRERERIGIERAAPGPGRAVEVEKAPAAGPGPGEERKADPGEAAGGPGEEEGVVAIGGGAGGAFGGRFGGKRSLRAYGGGRHTESAVMMGLIWLKNHQDPDGLWSLSRFMQNCKKGECTGAGSGDHDLGVTGLALLAFLGAAITPEHGRFRETVAAGVKALGERQDGDGCFGHRTADGRWIYNHAICTLAAVELAGLTGDESPYRPMAQKACDFLVSCQNPFLGWRYGWKPGDNDTSVTIWAAMALATARTVGLQVPAESFDGALRWFDKVTAPETFRVGYFSKGDSGSRLNEAVGRFTTCEAMTAAAAAGRIFILRADARDRADVAGACAILKENLPRWDAAAGTIDYYAWFWGSLAMFQIGGDSWTAWNEATKNALVPTQRREGCENGSWDPADAWGAAGGRVYSTAINVLTMEVYYRYGKVLGGK